MAKVLWLISYLPNIFWKVPPKNITLNRNHNNYIYLKWKTPYSIWHHGHLANVPDYSNMSSFLNCIETRSSIATSYGYLGNYHFEQIYPIILSKEKKDSLFQTPAALHLDLSDHIAPDGIFVALRHVAEAVLDLRVLRRQHRRVRRISPPGWSSQMVCLKTGSCVATNMKLYIYRML